MLPKIEGELGDGMFRVWSLAGSDMYGDAIISNTKVTYS